MESLKHRTVTITLTQNCNLACSYCYEHYKSQKSICIETAKRIIDYELSFGDKDEAIEFDLFGGEPFLEFELIKEITEYICRNKGRKNCIVFTTTNGTLVHGEIQKWLIEHSCCFQCGLSLDGTRDMHNLNRSNSYDDIDLAFFSSQYPDQEVKMTISYETLPQLAEGVIDMHNHGFLVACNLAYEIDWSSPRNSSILERELHKLIEFYTEHPTIEPCSMLGMGIYNVGAVDSETVRYCGAGKHMRAYDVNGNVYPCQFFMPLSLGEKGSEDAKTLVFPDEYIPHNLLEEKCRSCVISSVCPNCFGANYASTGNIYKRDDNMCRLTKIIMRARSYFFAKQWEQGMLREGDHDTEIILRAIYKIQTELEV